MARITLKVLALYFWFCSIVTLITMIVAFFQNSNAIGFLVFFTMIAAFIISGIYLWILSNNLTNQQKDRHEIKDAKIPEIQIEIKKNDVPKEILQDMKAHFSLLQAEGDIRILSDSLELIKTTKNIDMFISRYELAQRTALTLEQAVKAGINIPSKFTSFKELSDLKYDLVPKLLNNALNKVKIDALKLKTEKGQLNKIEKFYNLLMDNEEFFEDFDEYYIILEDLKSDIKKYATSNIGG